MDSAKSYYDLLEVSATASAAEIKGAYRTLAREYHPDGLPEHRTRLASEAAEKFKRIVVAYETLSDPGRRRTYDERLRRDARERAANAEAGRPRGTRSAASGSPVAPPPDSGPSARASAGSADAWVAAVIAHERSKRGRGVGGIGGGVAAVGLVTVAIAAGVFWLAHSGGAEVERKERIVRRVQPVVTSRSPTPTPAPVAIVYRDGTEQPVRSWRRDGDVTHLVDLTGNPFVVRSVRIDFARSRTAHAPPP